MSLALAEKWKVALLRLDEPGGGAEADPIGSESIWKDGRSVGSITSGGFGYGIGAYLAWAYLRPEMTEPGTELHVMTLGQTRRAIVVDGALWDAANERPRQDLAVAAE